MSQLRPGVGVVVGRFQVADLHEGHHAVIGEAAQHHKLCIFVGVQPAQLNTQSDPLDYPTREQMIKEAYPRAQVFELVDQYTNEGWSATLDQRVSALYPRDAVTLYGGRDSFQRHYTGRHKVREVDTVAHLSGTDLRKIDGSTVENHASFRRGLIYGAFNRYPPIYPCVDIVCTRTWGGEVQVLVGRRTDEGGVYRLPGGHVDPTDASDLDAARRELAEETGVEANNWVWLWSGHVKSWRDRDGGGTWRTALFHCMYAHGPAKGADDLCAVDWMPVEQLTHLLWADDHGKLIGEFLSSGAA